MTCTSLAKLSELEMEDSHGYRLVLFEVFSGVPMDVY